MPLGFLTEDSPRPEFAELYGATEMPTTIDPPPTEQNVRDATATLWFGSVNKLRLDFRTFTGVVDGAKRADLHARA
jgi:hypothetical protein